MSSVNVSPVVAVEDDDARRPLQADEEVVLSALVVVEPADRAAARERDVRLPRRLRQQALAAQLDEPAALVLEPLQRDAEQAVDHGAACSRRAAISAPICGVVRLAATRPRRPTSRSTRSHASVPALGVVAVHVRDLELAADGRLERRGSRRRRRRVAVEPDHRVVDGGDG